MATIEGFVMSSSRAYFQTKNNTLMLLGFILLFVSMTASSAFSVPPLGIPAPEFGINETVESVYSSDTYVSLQNKARIVIDPTSKYGALRNSETHNPTGSASGEYTVIYNNEIHGNVRSIDKNVHGIQSSTGGGNILVFNNKTYNNGGDRFQVCHKCNANPLRQPKNIYIGANDFNGDKENGVDLKCATDVIISQNTFSNYKIDFDSGLACPIVVGSDGTPTHVWVIYNEIFDSKYSIRVEEASDLWLVENTIHDIVTTAVALEKRGDLVRIINNTIYNADLLIDQYWRHEFSVNIHNNIVVDMVESQYGSHMYFDTYPFGSNNIIGDPLFADNVYTELSAVAMDNIDNSIPLSSNIIANASAVNAGTVGTYNAIDASGNPAIEVTRAVMVIAATIVDNPAKSTGGGSAFG